MILNKKCVRLLMIIHIDDIFEIYIIEVKLTLNKKVRSLIYECYLSEKLIALMSSFRFDPVSEVYKPRVLIVVPTWTPNQLSSFAHIFISNAQR